VLAGQADNSTGTRRAMTFIEALVASLILGVGVVGLISAATLALRNQQRCEYRTAAMYVASELMAQVEMMGPHIWTLGQPTHGTETRGNVPYEWKIEIKEGLAGELFSVLVTVDWSTAGGNGSVELATWLNDYRAKQLEWLETMPPIAGGTSGGKAP